MKSSKSLAALTLAGAMILGAAIVAPAFGDPSDAMSKPKKEETAAIKVGDTAPAFSLTDTTGKTVNLSDYTGKVVVLEWFNPECPFIVKHHSESKGNMTLNKLYDEFNAKGVVFLAVNSSAKGNQGYGKELNTAKKTEYKLPFPILFDEDGKVGHAYGAKTTPHCFVIGKDGKLMYKGAIDNKEHIEKAGDTNYVKNALNEILAGKPVTTPDTKPYGCSVKYASK